MDNRRSAGALARNRAEGATLSADEGVRAPTGWLRRCVRAALLAALLCVASDAEVVTRVIEPFPLTQVRLGDGPAKVGLERNKKYLLFLDPDRLLWTFRKQAGLPTPGEPCGGWEAPNCEVRGHFVGHYL